MNVPFAPAPSIVIRRAATPLSAISVTGYVPAGTLTTSSSSVPLIAPDSAWRTEQATAVHCPVDRSSVVLTWNVSACADGAPINSAPSAATAAARLTSSPARRTSSVRG